jgi:hypothetical protein
LENIFLTADDADFADLTLIYIRSLQDDKRKLVVNQQNQRHLRLKSKPEGKFNNGK